MQTSVTFSVIDNESKWESFENVYYKSHWAFQAISK